MHPATPHSELPSWLSPRTRIWAEENRAVLNAIYSAFHGSGSWPDPVQLERELRASGMRIGLVSSLDNLPPELGSHQTYPSRVRLSLLGLGCVPAARRLLQRYLAVVHLAIERYDQPEQPNRLSRADVAARLDIGSVETDRLSRLILDDGIWSGSGTADPKAWDFEIDPRVTRFENDDEVDAFLARLAEQRRTSKPTFDTTAIAATVQVVTAPSPDTAHTGLVTGNGKYLSPILVLLSVVGIGANISGVVAAPLPFVVAVSVSAVTAAVLHRKLLVSPPSGRAVGVVVVAGLVGGAATAVIAGFDDDSARGPVRYFVRPTQSLLIRRSETPSPGARQFADGPLADGDEIFVQCTTKSGWVKLTDGTFLPAREVRKEALARSPRTC